MNWFLHGKLPSSTSIEVVHNEEISAGVTRKRLVGKGDRLLQEIQKGDGE